MIENFYKYCVNSRYWTLHQRAEAERVGYEVRAALHVRVRWPPAAVPRAAAVSRAQHAHDAHAGGGAHGGHVLPAAGEPAAERRARAAAEAEAGAPSREARPT